MVESVSVPTNSTSTVTSATTVQSQATNNPAPGQSNISSNPSVEKPRNSLAGKFAAIFAQKTQQADSSQSNKNVLDTTTKKTDERAVGSTEEKSDVKVSDKSGSDTATSEESPQKVVKEFDINGKKVALDLSKPEVIAKKLVDLESGMRKAFAERDQYKSKISELQSKIPDEKQMNIFNQFNDLVEEYKVGLRNNNTFLAVDNFIKSVIGEKELLHWKQRQLERHSYLLTASPEERKRMEEAWLERDTLEQERYNIALEKEKINKYQDKIKNLEEQKLVAEINSLINPAYDKFAFPDKPKLNQILWQEAKEQMLSMLSQGKDLTKQDVSNIFKQVRESLEKEFKDSASKTLSEVISNKKQDVMTSLQNVITAKKDPKDVIDPSSLYKNGNIADSFRARFKK